MARLGAGQRVVRSIPDRQGNVYTKTSAGGKARAVSAVRYMDQREQTALYRLEAGQIVQTDRLEAAQHVEESDSKYVQHLAFTTTLQGEVDDPSGVAQQVAMSIQLRRPDAEIYALAIHDGSDSKDPNIHVHVVFGTDTTLRQRGAESDLTHFRTVSYQLEQRLNLEREQSYERQHRGGGREPEGGKMDVLEREDRYESKREKQAQRERGYDFDY